MTRGALALADPAVPPSGLPEAAPLIAQLVMDVLTGHRPVLQLAGRVTPQLYEALAAELSRGRVLTSVRRPVVWRTRTCVPANDVAEVAAVAHDASRAYPLALRLEWHQGRWRCVTIAAPTNRDPG